MTPWRNTIVNIFRVSVLCGVTALPYMFAALEERSGGSSLNGTFPYPVACLALLEAPCFYTHLVLRWWLKKQEKSLLSKLQGSAFTGTVTIVTVTVPRSTTMLLLHPNCKLHVCFPCMICLTRYVTAVIVTGHHNCIMPLQNSVAATKQQPQVCPDNRTGS